ncbi:MAG: methyl-accepting chemotaxis protein [Deltaproteobacteria bacterium]|jgi:methyl-accepting chemotaxis protein|nr:methyl-accepting chemotaxis protein [Deltaproteobacteria bacterium]
MMGFRGKIIGLLLTLTVIVVAQMVASHSFSAAMNDRVREKSTETIDSLARLVGEQKIEWAKDELKVNLYELDRLLGGATDKIVYSARFYLAQSRLARGNAPATATARRQTEDFCLALMKSEAAAVNGFGATFERDAFSPYVTYFLPYVYRGDNGELLYNDDEVGDSSAMDGTRTAAQIREEFEAELAEDYYATALPVGADRGNPPAEKVYWVRPYIDTTTNVPLISATFPIVDEGRALGVAFLDLSLDGLADVTKRAAGRIPGSLAVAFALGTGEVFAELGLPSLAPVVVPASPGSADKSFVTRNVQDLLGSQVFREFVGALELDEVRSRQLTYEGISYVALAANLKGLFGYLALIPEDGLYAEVKEAQELEERTIAAQRSDLRKLGVMTWISLALLLAIMFVITAYLSQTVKKITSEAQTLNVQAERIFAASQNVFDDAKRLREHGAGQTNALADTSSSINEISSQLHKTSSMAQDCAKAMDDTKSQVESGAQTVAEMSQAMASVNEASNQVNKIIHSIESIAFQTNLLALNASVEASRAGEAGQGFAVVAEEVRNLAVATSDSAKRTSVLLETVKKRAVEGQKAADNLVSKFSGIELVAQQADQYAAAINDSVKVETESVGSILASLDSLSRLVNGNNEVAMDSERRSESLSRQAENLNRTSESLIGILLKEKDV